MDKEITRNDAGRFRQAWALLRQALPLIGLVVGVVGVALAIYFHLQAIQERAPTYYVSPQRARILDVTGPNPSELQVLYRGRAVTGKNVVAVTLYLWNDGKLPIRDTDVLEGLRFELSKPSEILESRVLKISRGVTEFAARPVLDSAPGSLPISFRILERSDGAAIQIIYAGDPDATIQLMGTIVGVGTPRILRPRGSDSLSHMMSRERNLKVRKIAGWTIIGLGVALVLLGFRGAPIWRPLRAQAPRRGRWMSFVLGGLLYAAMGTYLLYDAYRTGSPGVPSSIWLEH